MAPDVDAFEWAMGNLSAAGISFEVVSDRTPPPGDPPGDRPPPAGTGGGEKEADETSRPERVDESRRATVGEWRRAILKADELNATAQHVALVLAEYMDRDGGGAWPSHATLAAVCHRGERSIRDALKAIESAGFVHVRRCPGRVSTYLATVPDGGEVIDHPGSLRSRQSQTPAVSTGLVRQSQHPHPGSLSTTTQPSTKPSSQKRAAPSLTDDPELYQSMVRLAEVSGARSPKAWVAKVYAEDIAQIIEETGRDAALAEISRRISKRSANSSHRDPEQFGHGPTAMVRENW